MATASLLSTAARRLEGKVALVTGGASGIGEYTAKTFAKHGARVVIADIQDDLGQSICKNIGSSIASYIHCNVTNEAHVQNAVDSTMSQYGKLDIMFNNAGIGCYPKPNIIDNTQSEFEEIIKVNLVGPFLGTKHAARVMIPAQQGSIITTASISSIIGGVTPHAYTSSKHGVLGLTRNTAVELGKYGIRVNCLSPQAVATHMTRSLFDLDDEAISKIYSNLKGAWCKVDDVANAALFLASDDSKFVSGHNLIIDGGFTIVNPAFSLLEGKVALITGGASGIGECTARLFTKQGAKVVIADIQDDLGQSICKELGPSETSSYIHCDVTKEAHVQNAVDSTIAKYGKLDIMYNNAGIAGSSKVEILGITQSEFERVIKINLIGPFLGTKHAARVMIPAKQGSIISTASVCSVMGGCPHPYTSVKHGVLGLTRNAAVELGKYGIRVNCVSPHITPTPLTRKTLNQDDDAVAANTYSNLKGASCEVEDTANAALFLASDDSKFISGHNLVVDGGITVTNLGFSMF